MMQKNLHDLFFQFLEKQEPYRSLLCLHGCLPDSSFFQRLKLPIIAADGAANVLVKEGVEPHLIVGDLDSATVELQKRIPCLKIPDQETNDLQKAMQHLKENNLLPTIVLGANGGYLDHILCNISLLAKEEKCLLYDPPYMLGFFLSQGIYRYSFPLMNKISLMGAPAARVNSVGLKWELKDYSFEWCGNHSCFNRTVLPEVTLEVKEGHLLLLLYLQSVEDAGRN